MGKVRGRLKLYASRSHPVVDAASDSSSAHLCSPVSGEVSTGVLLVEFSSGDLTGSHSKLNAKASGHFPF